MEYTEEQKDQIVTEICDEIATGLSLRQVIANRQNNPSKAAFLKWVDASELRRDQYARAREAQANEIFEEIIEIADNSNLDVKIIDGKAVVDGEAVQRSRVRIDARKWQLSKMLPKKYGDSVKLTGDADNPIQSKLTIEILPASGRIASSEGEIDD